MDCGHLEIFYFVFSKDRNPTFRGMNEQFYRQSRLSGSPARKPSVLKRVAGQSQHLTLLPTVTAACGFRTFSFKAKNSCCFPGGLVFSMLFFLCVVCAFCCMKYMFFCDLSPLQKLKSLPFQYRSDCVCSPADLRESVKG